VADLSVMMANLAQVYHWGWLDMMRMPLDELYQFHELAYQQTKSR